MNGFKLLIESCFKTWILTKGGCPTFQLVTYEPEMAHEAAEFIYYSLPFAGFCWTDNKGEKKTLHMSVKGLETFIDSAMTDMSDNETGQWQWQTPSTCFVEKWFEEETPIIKNKLFLERLGVDRVNYLVDSGAENGNGITPYDTIAADLRYIGLDNCSGAEVVQLVEDCTAARKEVSL